MIDSKESLRPVRLWLGLRVVPVGFSGVVLSGPLLWPGRVRVILTRLMPAAARAVAGARAVARRRSRPAVAGRSVASASRGPPANRSRSAVSSAWLSATPVNLAERYAGECRICHLVQPQPGIGEVPAGQARIQPPAIRISWPGP
jgi:hypothetical protein